MDGADVVVVGSGAGGATIAGVLARAGASVILVDGGPQVSQPAGSNLRNAHPGEAHLEDQADHMRRFRVPVIEGDGGMPGLASVKLVYGVGGMLTQWVGNCPEPDPLTERPMCISVAEWRALVARSRALLRVRHDLADGGVRQERILERLAAVVPRPEGARDVQPMPTAATRRPEGLLYHGADVLLAGDAPSIPSTLRIVPDALAVRIARHGRRAEAVEVVDRSSRERVRIVSGVVVLAAGTVATPRLLVASGIDAGPALGRYLIDHPSVQSTVRLHPDLVVGAPPDDPMFMAWIPFAPDRPWHGMVHRSYPWSPPAQRPTPDEARGHAELRTLTAMRPDPANALAFDPSHPDPFGLPSVRGTMRLSAADREAVVESERAHRSIADAIEDPERPTRIEVKATMPRGAPHLMGSHRMGAADDGTSVVDTCGRVWTMDNVYLAGNGVLPGPNSCNPALSVVALALRSADAILRELRSASG